MKLKTSTRISLVTVLLSTVLTIGIGTFSAVHSRNTDLSRVDAYIELAIKSAAENPNQAIGAALFAIESNRLDLTLALITQDGLTTVVNQSSLNLQKPPTWSALALATHGSITINDSHPYRIRTLLVPGGDFLVVAQSLDIVTENFRSNIASVGLFTFLVDVIALFCVLIYFRRLNRRETSAALERMQSFLGDASHELRTPLTVIKGYVEMLSKGQLTGAEDSQRAFGRVQSEITRMENLIQDLLLLAELGESARAEKEEIDLGDLVGAYIRDFITLNPEREIKTDVGSNITILGSKDHLARFIQNALNNISRHTDSDVPVKVGLKKSGKFIELVIEDGGPGLPESAYRESVRTLNRFDASRSRESGGSGLGMSIMAAVLVEHQGTITLRKSELGGLAVIGKLPIG